MTVSGRIRPLSASAPALKVQRIPTPDGILPSTGPSRGLPLAPSAPNDRNQYGAVGQAHHLEARPAVPARMPHSHGHDAEYLTALMGYLSTRRSKGTGPADAVKVRGACCSAARTRDVSVRPIPDFPMRQGNVRFKRVSLLNNRPRGSLTVSQADDVGSIPITGSIGLHLSVAHAADMLRRRKLPTCKPQHTKAQSPGSWPLSNAQARETTSGRRPVCFFCWAF